MGDRVHVAAKSGVTKNLTEPGIYSGFPAESHRRRLKREAKQRRRARKRCNMNLSTRKSRQVDATANIHPTAVIEDGVVIGAKCQIGAFAVIGRDKRWVENIVHSYAHVGSAPQVREAVQHRQAR